MRRVSNLYRRGEAMSTHLPHNVQRDPYTDHKSRKVRLMEAFHNE
jgi:hypothetical protein